MAHIKLFIPGPVEISESVRMAFGGPMIGHRGKGFQDLYARVQPGLRKLFQTQQPVFLGTGSAWSVMEAALRNLVQEKVLVCIITDGMENASRFYGSDQVKAMIKRQQDKYGWEFIFLGANIDAVETAGRYGIRADRASRYHNDKAGIDINYGSMSETIVNLRVNKTINDDWKQSIDDDYQKRSK